MLINITSMATHYSNKLTITQVEAIFKKFNLNIDKKEIKRLQKNDFLPELDNIRYYKFNHIIIIYIICILEELVKEDVIKKHITCLFDLELEEIIKFYDKFYNKVNDNETFNDFDNDLYKLLYLALVYKNSLCI